MHRIRTATAKKAVNGDPELLDDGFVCCLSNVTKPSNPPVAAVMAWKRVEMA